MAVASAVPLRRGVLRGVGSAPAVGGLPAGGCAEPLGAAARGASEHPFDGQDDFPATVLAVQPGAGEPVPVGWQRGIVTHSGSVGLGRGRAGSCWCRSR